MIDYGMLRGNKCKKVILPDTPADVSRQAVHDFWKKHGRHYSIDFGCILPTIEKIR